MINPNYTYAVTQHNCKAVLLIQENVFEENPISSNIENVISEICAKRNIKQSDYLILFKDSKSLWDGYDLLKKEFNPLHGSTWKEAVDKMQTNIN